MPELIRIKVKCFSQVKYALGRGTILMKVPAGSTTRELENQVRQMARGKLHRIALRIAVNKNYITEPVELHEGDEVALIPPVQGG